MSVSSKRIRRSIAVSYAKIRVAIREARECQSVGYGIGVKAALETVAFHRKLNAERRACSLAQPRERRTGRYGYEGQWDRLCVCGHTLGVHAAEAPHPCFNSDPGVPDATGEACDCERFRPARPGKGSVR